MKKISIPLTLLLSTTLFADDNENFTFLEELITTTEEYRKNLHTSIVNTSSNIDNFFFDDNLNHVDYNSAYGLLELSLSQNQHESVVLDQKLKIKFRLPRLKEKLHLEIETDEERESKDFIENKDSNSKHDNLNIGIGYYKTFKNQINLKTKIGLKIKNEFDPFIKLTADKTFESKKYFYTITQSLKESKSKKTESTSSFKIDKPLNEEFSVHNYNQYYWNSINENDSELYGSVYLDQKLNNKNYLRYTLYTNLDNIDSSMKVKRYSAQLKYRYFLKKWMYVDTIPENYYKEDQDFKPRYAIKFNLGIYFNKDAY